MTNGKDKKKSLEKGFLFSKVECVTLHMKPFLHHSFKVLALSFSLINFPLSLQSVLFTQSLLYISPSVSLNYFTPLFSRDNRPSNRNN